MILNEILILARLRHPNIILLLGVAIDEEYNLYIITELHPQHSLDTFLDNNRGKLSVGLKVNLLFEIARALNYVHSLNPPILHRDIKPQNVFITSNNTAKLGDFG